MDSNSIYQVLVEQREDLYLAVGADYVYRKEVDMISLSSKLAQVVIGVRRSGKSTLCHMALQKAGVEYAYVNFDDDRLATLKVQDLNLVLESLYRVYGNPKTLNRELRPFIEASNKTGCDNLTLITCSDSRMEKYEGKDIRIITAIEWLLS